MAPALQAAEKLSPRGIDATVVNARFVRPLDATLISNLAGRIKKIVTIEENVLNGGFGSGVLKLLQESGQCDDRGARRRVKQSTHRERCLR